MAIRVPRRVRPLLAVAALSSTLLAAPTLAAAAPHGPQAKPRHHQHDTIASVRKQLDVLAKKNDQLVETFDQARVEVHRRDAAAQDAERAAAAATAAYVQAHSEFSEVIQQQYEDTSFGAAGALLDSGGGSSYVDRLDTLGMVSTHTADVVRGMRETHANAVTAAGRAQRLLAAATEQRDEVVKHRNAVRSQIETYKTKLTLLTAAQRARYRQASSDPIDPSTLHLTAASTKGARKAVAFALKQVGKPYVFGSGGPNSFDCSGLTMVAWQHGGVSLPHSAADQYNYGHHVDEADLQPGDLVFFYSPISHVAIYIGDGKLVSAPTTGEDVKIVPINYTDEYAGATRLT